MVLVCLLLVVFIPSWVAGQGLIDPAITDTSSYTQCRCPKPTSRTCACVDYQYCDKEGNIVTNGGIFVTVRFGGEIVDYCSGLEACCMTPEDDTETEAPVDVTSSSLPTSSSVPPGPPSPVVPPGPPSPVVPPGPPSPVVPPGPPSPVVPTGPPSPVVPTGPPTPEGSTSSPTEEGDFVKGGCGQLPTSGTGLPSSAVRGPLVNPGDVPWLLAIIVDSVYFRCAATLLGPTVALTGAQCVERHVVRELTLTTPTWNEGVSRHSPQNRTISEILIHPNYNNLTRGGDIALLIMSEPMKANSEVGAACLPPPGSNYEGQSCVVAGWGKKKGFAEEGDLPSQMELPVVPRAECQRRLRLTHLNRYFRLASGSICAGGHRDGFDACAGDGGGPLACPQDGRFYVAGTVSWGIGCGMRGIPGVYGDVVWANSWIRAKLQERGLLDYAVPAGGR